MRQCPLCSRLYDEAAEFCPQDGRVLLLPDALLGRVVDGKYRIDSLLGGGGQSSVYRATHVMLERPAALKVVRGAVASDAEAVARFRREALAVAHLKHASIVTVHDFGIDDEAGAYLVMELLDGRSLGREILETGRLAPDEAIAVMRHVCSALTTAHTAGIVHRDLKPDNIFLETRPDGARAVKILDFGIAKLRNAAQLSALDGGYDTDPNVSISVPFGTAAYMSPEQCRAEPVDARSDIYSIGCVFYEMLAGRPPFLSDAVGSLCESHVEATPEPPSAYAPGLPAELDEIVLTALAKRPEDRHQTAEALERALDEALARAPVHTAKRVASGPLDLRGRAAQRDRAARTNLAGEITTFVGRAEELAAVRGALGGSRLVTVTGSSGAGKTRLAERLGAELLDEFPDGVWQARLAPLSEPSLVPKAVASALGIREETGRPPVRSLIDFLQGKRLLLLLDNCEHLVAACAELADALLRACPFVRVLATSQEPLGIFGEAVHPLPPLSLPREGEAPSFEEIAWFEAIQLFVDRARLAAPSFALTPANAPVVVRVCQRLDGIPLAIELAAARTKLLPVEQIDARLHDRFRLLTSGSRTADPRQRTLQAAIDWSHDLLEEGARTLFRRLSIFSGGFTLEVAEAVTAGGGIARDEVLYLLSNLVDKSLVLVNESGATARYRMLQTIRQYAGERLRASGEAASVRAKHRDAFLALAEHAEGELKGPEQDVWLDRLEAEHANLRAALEWSKTDAAASDAYLRLAGALWEYWLVRGHVREGREWLESALTLSSPAFDAPRARALDGAGVLARLQGDYQQAVRRHQEGITLWRKIGDRAGEAGAITHLGIVRQWQGDTDRARQLLEEALALSREVDNPWGVALALKNLGVIAHVLGETERATERYRESLEISRSLDDAWEIASTINNLAVLLASQGEYERAAELFEENLSLNRRLGEKRGIAMALNNLGEMAQSQGDYGRAAELLSESLLLNVDAGNARLIAYGLECFVSLLAAEGCDEPALRLASAAEALRDRIGSPLSPAEREDLDRSIAAARAALTPEHAARAWEDGRAMSIEEAVDEALSSVVSGQWPVASEEPSDTDH